MVGGERVIQNRCQGTDCEIISHAQEPFNEEYVQK